MLRDGPDAHRPGMRADEHARVAALEVNAPHAWEHTHESHVRDMRVAMSFRVYIRRIRERLFRRHIAPVLHLATTGGPQMTAREFYGRLAVGRGLKVSIELQYAH